MGFENEDYMKKEIERSIMIKEGYEKLKEIKGFWSGPDIKMEKEEILRPGDTRITNLILNKNDFPSSVDLDWGVFRCLKFSTRSRLAQAGIEIEFNSDSLSVEDIEQINKGKDISASVVINNFGSRAVKVSEDVIRFFWVNEEDRLEGDELLESFSSGEIRIEDKEGKDWFIADRDYDPGKDDDIIKKNMKNEEFIKNSKDAIIVFPVKGIEYNIKGDELLEINSRADLEKALIPISGEIESLDFRVGETPTVHLGENICASINIGAYDQSKRHIASPFIDPGFEGKIRYELLGKLDYIEIYIYKK